MFQGRWTADEHSLFLSGLQKYNKQWKQIAELVKTRTVVQIRTHAQKYFQKMDKMKDGKMGKPVAGSSTSEKVYYTSPFLPVLCATLVIKKISSI